MATPLKPAGKPAGGPGPQPSPVPQKPQPVTGPGGTNPGIPTPGKSGA